MAEKSMAPTERPDGAKLIAEERWRQQAPKPDGEGWSEAHDDGHATGDLALAAACYILAAALGEAEALKYLETLWPWGAEWWKPTEPKRMLVKAGALVAAEVDRLERLAAPVQEVDRGA